MDINSLDIATDSELTDEERVTIYNTFTQLIFDLTPGLPPVCNVQMLPISRIKANYYNPNQMAPPEARLLRLSMSNDGFTMPIIVNRSKRGSDYILVDGFHRFEQAKTTPALQPIAGYVPCVVFRRKLESCMSSSVRHNTARGTHQVELIAHVVMDLKRRNWSNERIGRELGMDRDEVLRLQQVTGLASSFHEKDFSTSWE
ncbi:IbrB-like domain-containing protein [Vibrio jasicida]|uniref:IbrB-like domain-containing protein n=1 Tax=Vibrio jasicida TaxID=766224 RepID=UPI0040695C7F